MLRTLLHCSRRQLSTDSKQGNVVWKSKFSEFILFVLCIALWCGSAFFNSFLTDFLHPSLCSTRTCVASSSLSLSTTCPSVHLSLPHGQTESVRCTSLCREKRSSDVPTWIPSSSKGFLKGHRVLVYLASPAFWVLRTWIPSFLCKSWCASQGADRQG